MGRSRRGSSPATARRFFLVTAVSFGFPAPGTLGPTHATMGTFDGIHRGHLALLKPLIAQAKHAGAASVLVTFEPHPRCVLDPDHCPPNLTTLDEKAWLLEQLGLDHLIVIPFTPQLAALSAPAFMQRLLRGMQLRRLVIGEDHRFGHGRRGDPDSHACPGSSADQQLPYPPPGPARPDAGRCAIARAGLLLSLDRRARRPAGPATRVPNRQPADRAKQIDPGDGRVRRPRRSRW
ncbi:MAG: FAD synthetase family protein [Chloroflexi bacterium]|nr:MAG: FAD synthetase family protein [Chloroflexota bacterium]